MGSGMSVQKKFAALRPAQRHWAVASIHGEAARLRALHRELEGRIRIGDNLIYLGNFLGRGGDVLGTVDELLMFRRTLLGRVGADCDDIVYLRGSQEEMWNKLLQIQFAPNPREVVDWMVNNGVGATISAYGGTPGEATAAANGGAVAMTKWTNQLRNAMRAADGHNALMGVLRRAAFTEDQTLLFVHAGIDVSRPLSEQKDSFWWGGGSFDSIDSPYGEFGRVVRGFDSKRGGMKITAYTATIDGGCGFGGPLMAVCFDAKGEVVDTVRA